jgi:peptidyl-prolyl cis-trans isomerase C
MIGKWRIPAAGTTVVVILKRHFYLLIITCLFLSGCDLYEKPEEKTVITVGSRDISVGDLTSDIKRFASQMGISSRRTREILDPLVNRIVDQYLILEYGKEKGIVITEEELNAAVKEMEADYQEAELQEILLHSYIDIDEWKEGLRHQLLVKKIVASVSDKINPVSFREIKHYFDSHQDEFKHPPMVKFRQIVTASEQEAKALLKELNDGADMGELARQHSIAPEADNGGEVGWVALGDLEKDMATAISSLPVGVVSRVVHTSYGYHIFEVLAKRPEGFKSLPEAMVEIESKLFYQKENQFYDQWLQDLRDLYPVKINKELLQTLDLG